MKSNASASSTGGESAAPVRLALDSEDQEQRDQQREDAERLGHGEAEDQAAELPVGGGRSADRAGKVIAEERAEADARAAHAEARHAGADILAGVDDRLFHCL